MVNGSYLSIMLRDEVKVIHVGYLVTQIISPMLAKEWMEKGGFTHFMVEFGVIGVEGLGGLQRTTLEAGP